VGAILPLDLLDLDQPQIRLVDERGGLQCMSGVFALRVPPREAPQFVVDERDEPIERIGLATPPGEEQRRGGRRLFQRPILRLCAWIPAGTREP
jgi:hypothetical protein